MTNQELIEKAAAVINTRKNGDYLEGDVGAALETVNGNIYVGVCIDTMSSMGFCAEANAIGSMVTDGEARIKRIVAVLLGDNRKAQIIPPCGRCREFIRQIHPDNLNTEVLLSATVSETIRQLLPHYDRNEEI